MDVTLRACAQARLCRFRRRELRTDLRSLLNYFSLIVDMLFDLQCPYISSPLNSF